MEHGALLSPMDQLLGLSSSMQPCCQTQERRTASSHFTMVLLVHTLQQREGYSAELSEIQLPLLEGLFSLNNPPFVGGLFSTTHHLRNAGDEPKAAEHLHLRGDLGKGFRYARQRQAGGVHQLGVLQYQSSTQA